MFEILARTEVAELRTIPRDTTAVTFSVKIMLPNKYIAIMANLPLQIDTIFLSNGIYIGETGDTMKSFLLANPLVKNIVILRKVKTFDFSSILCHLRAFVDCLPSHIQHVVIRDIDIY